MVAWRDMDDDFMPSAPPAARAAFAEQTVDQLEAAGHRGSILQRAQDRFRRLSVAAFPLPLFDDEDVPF